jgi:hypothetical protein
MFHFSGTELRPRAIGNRFGWKIAIVGLLTGFALPLLGMNSAGASTATVPAAPTNVSAIAGYDGAEVTWTVGANGGDPITSFVITAYVGGTPSPPADIPAGTVGSNLDPTPGAVDTYDLVGDSGGTAFSVTVAAENTVGTGAASAPSNVVTGSSTPTAPYAPSLVSAASNSPVQITLAWTAPGDNGSTITSFTVTPYRSGTAQTPETLTALAGSSTNPAPGSDDSTTLTGLVSTDSYTYTVAATNGIGSGPASAPSAAVQPEAGVPSLELSQNNINFGSVTVGDFVGPSDVTITNNGTGNDTVTSFTFSGVGAYDYLVDSACGLLTPGQSCQAAIYFNPGTLGARPATITVVDDTASGTQIQVTGMGTEGYYITDAQGEVDNFGDAQWYGDLAGHRLNQLIVSMAPTGDNGGYWLTAADGGVFAFGDAQYFGSTGGIHLNKPIVGMAPTPDGGGYWLVASDGGIFAFGDAQYFGSTGGIHLNKPIVGMAATPDGGGYWLVASDGGIFAFGDAPYHGSTGGITLNKPIVGMAATPDGGGYWLTASDGGVFAFGDAPFYGSDGGSGLTDAIGLEGDGPPTFQAIFDIPADRSHAVGRSTTEKAKLYRGTGSA